MKEKKTFVFGIKFFMTVFILLFVLSVLSSCKPERNQNLYQVQEKKIDKKKLIYHLYTVSFEEPDLKVYRYQIPNTNKVSRLMNSVFLGYFIHFPEVSRLNSLIENHDKNLWYFLNTFHQEKDGEDFDWKLIRLEKREGKIHIEPKPHGEKGASMEKISPDNTFLYEHSGGIYDLENNKYNLDFFYFFTEKNIEFIGTALTIPNDELMIFQFLQDSGVELTRNSPNYIAGVSKKTKKVLWKSEAGLAPISFRFSITDIHEDQLACPLEESPDGKKLAFINRYKDDSKENYHPLWLSLFDPDTKKVEKIVRIPWPENDEFIFIEKVFVRWSPDAASNLIAVGASRTPKMLLIDCKTKKIVKEFDKKVISLRWSPDGKQLGILTKEGEILAYRPKTESLTEIDRDKYCFDIFWEPQN